MLKIIVGIIKAKIKKNATHSFFSLVCADKRACVLTHGICPWAQIRFLISTQKRKKEPVSPKKKEKTLLLRAMHFWFASQINKISFCLIYCGIYEGFRQMLMRQRQSNICLNVVSYVASGWIYIWQNRSISHYPFCLLFRQWEKVGRTKVRKDNN